MSASADLRITSKRAYYDNGKPYGESETITLYIYNAGPDPAVAPTVKAGYSWSMDWTAVTTTLREAEVPAGRQPSKDIRAGSLIWRNLTSPTTHFVSWDMVTTLPDLRAGVLMELSLSFPMTQTSASNRDYTATASVASSVTTDPLEKNNSTTYLITPNHRSDGPAYWNTPGDLKILDSADLRIASKRAYYDNGKPYGESETITLYIYNAGPSAAAAPVVKAGYSWSMDWTAVTTTLREAEGLLGHQPSQDIRADSLIWKNLTSPTTHFVNWDMVTTLPDLRAGVLMELSLSFPMTQTASTRDYTATASVTSPGANDPFEKNNSTTYLITPNHRSDGPAYWNTPGDLKNLGFIGLTGVETLSQADLRIASVRAYYNNNLGYGKSETLSFYVFNDGPTIAVKPVLTAGYTTSMDWTKITCSAEQVWVPEGINPSYLHDKVKWQPLQDVSCRYVQWDAICDLPDIPPSTLYRVNISFPMNNTASSQDYTATASIASEAKELNPADNSTTYVITPNHGTNNTDEYWKTKGEITQLDGSSVPSAREGCSTGWLLDTPIIVTDLSKGNRRQIRLAELEGQIKTTTLQSYDTQKKTLESMRAIGVGYRTSSKACVVTFSADGKNGLTYTALPDTLVYVLPFTRRVGEDDVRLGYWIPVRMLWVGARIRGMGPDGGLTTTYVLDVQQVERAGQVYQSAEPRMLGMSHSYVIGTLKGGVLTHNPKDSDPYGSANVSAILQAFSIIANNLIAIATPTAPHGYSLRYRCPTDPPAPAPVPGMPFVPIIPADIPRRGKDGIWLIYLYEESMPAAVENARAAVEGGRHPAILTYDPAGVVARRQQSTGRSQAQRELLQLNTVESLGQVGTLGRLDRDEYPPAIAREAGNGALVTYVEAGNNRRVGSLMGQQFGASGIQPGDRFRYVIIHKNMANVKYLDENSEDEAQIDLLSIKAEIVSVSRQDTTFFSSSILSS